MKQFETFGEYMFDLLFAPLKKGRKTVNQLRIFFKVMGREFDDLKAAIFRVRSEANVASCSEVMLPVHGQDPQSRGVTTLNHIRARVGAISPQCPETFQTTASAIRPQTTQRSSSG